MTRDSIPVTGGAGYVDGGLRTPVYDNRVRVDNVAHALIAAPKYPARPVS